MNNCCNNNKTSANHPKLHCCPINGLSYASVKRKTLLHHIKQPWQGLLTDQAYYFCTDPKCEVVYFGQDNTIIQTHDLRTTVWQKSDSETANICYCFGVTKKLASSNKKAKAFVIEQTKNSLCSCETSNPSGHCCLKDFPKQ